MKLMFEKGGHRTWLAIVGTTMIVLLTAFVMVQQSTRLAANDAPLALNQAVRARLDNRYSPDAAVLTQPSNLSDLAPFAILTDSKLNVEASSTPAGKAMILPPSGSFAYTKAHGQNRFTWQPSPGLRIATIITSYQGGSQYIVTGQSLGEAQSRIQVYTALMVLAGLGVIIWATLALAWHQK
jgi:hypothetical protein